MKTCWLHLLRIPAFTLPKPSALEARQMSCRNFLSSLVYSCKITLCSLSVWSGERGTVNRRKKRRRLPTCKRIIFSQDPCSNRNNCLVSWNSGTPPSNSLSLASQQCLRSTGEGWANPLVSSSPVVTAPNLVHSFKWVSLQPNTKLTDSYTVKSQEMFRPGWKACRVTQICSLHFLFQNDTFWHPIQNWNLFYRGWSSS